MAIRISIPHILVFTGLFLHLCGSLILSPSPLYASESAWPIDFSSKKKNTRTLFSPFQALPLQKIRNQQNETQAFRLNEISIAEEKIHRAKTNNRQLVTNRDIRNRNYSNREMTDLYFDEERLFISKGIAQILERVITMTSQQEGEKTIIEAHCDERGSSSYNLALGEQRGRAIMQYLHSRGVPSTQIDMISYGQEKPLCNGREKACREANLRLQGMFQMLSIHHSRSGCMIRILRSEREASKGQWMRGHNNPFIRQIHVASPIILGELHIQ